MTDEPNSATGARTLTEVLENLSADGFATELIGRPEGWLLCRECRSTHEAGEFEVKRVERLEGVSDPGDEALVAGLVCPSCGTKGVYVARYGPEASESDVAVLEHLRLTEG